MFDPAGGTAPDIAGQDIANPTAALFAMSTLLMHLGKTKTSLRLKSSVLACLGKGRTTRDLGGKLGTRAFTQAVVGALKGA